MEHLNLILRSTTPYKVSIWHKHSFEFNLNDIFKICVQQLTNDLSNPQREYIPIKSGDTIGLHEYNKTEKKHLIKYYKLSRIEGNENGFGIWCKIGSKWDTEKKFESKRILDHVVLSEQIDDKRLSKLSGSYCQYLTSAISPVEILHILIGESYRQINKIELNEGGKLRLFCLKRTKILLVIDHTKEEIEEELKNVTNNGICFADIFSTAFDEYNINSLSHQISHRVNDVIIFHRLSDALQFVESNPDEKYLIITNKFTQLYSHKNWQSINTIDNYNLLHLGRIEDLKYFTVKDSLVLDQTSISVQICVDENPGLNKLKNTIKEVYDSVADDIFVELKRIKERYKNSIPEIATAVTHYQIYLLKILSWTESNIKNEKNLRKRIGTINIVDYDPQNISIEKIIAINKYLKIGPHYLLTDNSVEIDVETFEASNKLKTVDKNLFLTGYSNEYPVIITFVDRRWITSTLLPAILFGNVSIENVLFVLYKPEKYWLINILKFYFNNLGKYIVSESVVEPEGIGENDGESDQMEDDLSGFDFKQYSSRFYVGAQSANGELLVKVVTFGLSDNNSEYLAFLSLNYKPYLLESNDIRRVSLDSITNNDQLLFFEGGERGLLEAFRTTFFEDDGYHINKVHQWKGYLKEYLEYDDVHHRISGEKLDLLIKNLKTRGLHRTDNDVLRWLDVDSIATLRPGTDFQIIASVIGNAAFQKSAQEIANSCVYLQTKCKVIGKTLKKLAVKDLVGASEDKFIKGASSEIIKEKLNDVSNKIKLLNVEYIDKTENTVKRHDSNRLILQNNANSDSPLLHLQYTIR